MSVELQAQLDAAIALHQKGQLDLAAAQYAQIITTDPGRHDACHLLALILYQRGDRENACALWQQAIKALPSEPLYRNNCGEMLRQMGHNQDAEMQFTVAVALKPDFAEAHNNLGLSQLDRKAYAEARDSFAAAISLNPEFCAAYNNMGSALKSLGEYANAFDCFLKATQLDPNYARAWNNLGLSCHELKQPNEAEECFRTALRLAPGLVDAHLNLARLLRDLQRHEEAFTQTEQGLLLQPNKEQRRTLCRLQGESARDLGRFEVARSSFARNLSDTPGELQTIANAQLSFTLQQAADYYSLGPVPVLAGEGIRRVALFAPGDHYVNMLWGLKRAFEKAGIACVIGWPLLNPVAMKSFIDQFSPDLIIEINRTRHQAKVIPAGVKHVAWVQDGTLAFDQDITDFGGSDRTYFMAQPEAVGYPSGLMTRDSHYGFLLPAADPAVYHPLAEPAYRYDFSFAGFIPAPQKLSVGMTVLQRRGQSWELDPEALEKLLRAAGVFQWSVGDCAYPMIHQRLSEHLGLAPAELVISDAAFPKITALMRLMDRKDLLDQALDVSDSLLINGPDTWLQWPRFAPHHKGMLYDARALADSYRSSRIVLHNGVSALHPRTFECLACGSALLINRCYTDDKPGSIHNYLTAGEHYIEYTLPEARETLREALADPVRLKRICAATQAQVLAKHTWDHRVRQLLAEL